MDYFLKFASQAEAESVLYAPEQGGDEALTPRYANIDTVGVIHRPTGALDAEGAPVTAPIDGWHVNVRLMPGEDDTALLPYAITPANPMRVWA